MCGIAGIFRRRGRDGGDAARLAAMTDRLRHRGPDDHGYLALDSGSGEFSLGRSVAAGARGDVFLGNRRLAITDTSAAGRQPITNERRTVFVTFNGAIYNHPELRRDLEACGHRFGSASDTEVIVHAYEEWGDDCVRRFNGMWAFALWDQERRRLFCSRDRFGVKPFYAVLDDGAFLFASEIKAILAAIDGRPAPDLGVIRDFLGHGRQCHGADTFFRQIRRLPAAHNWVITHDSAAQTRYWDYSTRSHRYDVDHPEETFRELLSDAVRLRLRSDVPVGIALSGGLDSTTVSALARRHLAARPIKVFHAEFPGTPYDERRYAELVADRYGMEFHSTRYPVPALVDDLRQVVWHMDDPTGRPQVLARWRVMEMAAREVKVVLEGQGSDELLAGYPLRYFGDYARAELGRPGLRLRTLARLGAAALELYRIHGLGPLRRLMAGARVRRRALHPDLAALPAEPRAGRAELPGPPFGDPLTRRLHADHARDVLPELLEYGDAISMAHSVETRLPFLDHRLVEFAFQLPFRSKFDGATTKVLLRRSCGDLLPPEILARRDKVGFNTPTRAWLLPHLDSSLRPQLLSDRARRRHLLDTRQVERALRRFADGDRAGLAHVVFQWLSLELWFQLFIDA